MKILVTGNCGFIGQNFVRMFSARHEIVGFDFLGYAADVRAMALCPTVVGDLSSLIDIEGVFRKHGSFDAIVHFGAESHVDNSIKSPRCFLLSNTVGTFNVLECARQFGVPRTLIASTDEVFGDLMPGDPPFSNPCLLKPSSPYSASKAAGDLFALAYHRTYDLDVVITRSCNNYGMWQYKEKFLPVIILNALNDRPIPVYGNGANQREWLFVEDNCCGIMAALEHGKSGGTYNLGSGIEARNIDMVGKVL